MNRFIEAPHLPFIDERHFIGGPELFHKAAEYLDSVGLRKLTDEEQAEFSLKYSQSLISGIEQDGNPDSLPMYDTKIGKIDKEKFKPGDKVVVIETGGTKIRGSVAIVDENRNMAIMSGEDGNPLYKEVVWINKNLTLAAFYDNIIKTVSPLLKSGSIKPDALAFVYSFPGESVEAGPDIDVIAEGKFSKEFKIADIEGKSVGNELKRRLVEAGVLDQGEKLPMVVMNDTVAVAGSVGIGGVVASGMNIAATAFGKLYNTESGSGKVVPETSLSEVIDSNSAEPGFYKAEKQISGIYMPLEIQRVIRELKHQGFLPQNLLDHVATSYISDRLTKEYAGKLKRKIDNPMPLNPFVNAILDMIVARARMRSAQLSGVMFGTIVRTFPGDYPSDIVSIPVEGAVFKYIRGYREIVNEHATKFAGGRKTVDCFHKDHAGILGAAEAALSRAYSI